MSEVGKKYLHSDINELLEVEKINFDTEYSMIF